MKKENTRSKMELSTAANGSVVSGMVKEVSFLKMERGISVNGS